MSSGFGVVVGSGVHVAFGFTVCVFLFLGSQDTLGEELDVQDCSLPVDAGAR
ncbi:MAG: hypothetical protein WAW59_05710 [Patescibacteria group bacterium]